MLHDPKTFADVNSFGWLVQSSRELIHNALTSGLIGRTAVVSSLGSESAVLLHLVSQVDPDAPVLFLDTQMMFAETLEYQVSLARHLQLTNVQILAPDANEISKIDPDGSLNGTDPDTCCFHRKVKPLQKALSGYDAWINGRKRNQSQTRSEIRPVEAEANGRLKINPLIYWEAKDVKRYFERFDLPRHPLASKGFTSIGCAPCTAKPAEGADARSGRWAGRGKTECGIHTLDVAVAEQPADAGISNSSESKGLGS